MKTIKNLTPHVLNLVTGGVTESFPSVGIARVDLEDLTTNLPPEEHDTLLVVSLMVAEACPERRDLRVPDKQIRDASGRICGCEALAEVWDVSPLARKLRQAWNTKSGDWHSEFEALGIPGLRQTRIGQVWVRQMRQHGAVRFECPEHVNPCDEDLARAWDKDGNLIGVIPVFTNECPLLPAYAHSDDVWREIHHPA